MLFPTTILLAVCLLQSSTTVAGHGMELERTEQNVKIPKSISDHTATLSLDNNLIYLAGGCDDPNGNVLVQDGNSSFFVCNSVSDSFYSFDPATNTFVTLLNMPSPRYRHAAVAVKNQLWLVGGRNLEDDLVQNIDIFDIPSQTWYSFPLPENLVTSDLAAWSTPTQVYFAGGYNSNYTAQSRVFGFNVENLNLKTFDPATQVIQHDPLLEARGDLAATVNVDTGYAYVAGGFTDANDFCEPLASVERYSLDGDTWIGIAFLPTARADKVMVNLEGHTISMGGERQAEGICEMVNPSPGEMTVLEDDVQVLNEDDSTWEVLQSLPETRFRFAAVVYNQTIYTFGGQIDYDETCTCMKTTDEVVAYMDVGDTDSHNNEQSEGSDQSSPQEGSTTGASVTADGTGTSGAWAVRGISTAAAVVVAVMGLC